MGRLRTLALALACVLVVAGCDWAQWGLGPEHGGTNLENGITTGNVSQFVASPVAHLPITGQAVSTMGLVFAQRDGLLTEFDAATNGIVWTAALPAGSTVGGTPAVDKTTRTVFVVVSRAGSPILLGFDVDGFRNCNNIDNTCLPLFSAQVGTTNAPATPPLVDGGRVFVNGASSLYAFSASGQTNCLPIQGTAYCNPLWSAATGFAAAGVGPAAASGVIYDAVKTGAIFGVRAFAAGNGSTLWSGPLSAAVSATPSVDGNRLFVPSGQAIPAFARTGCGNPTCVPAFSLVRKAADAAGNFLGTPAIDGAKVFATNANGALYAWSESGCGASTCQPTSALALNAPNGGSTNYSQTVAIAGGMVFVLAQKVVSAANHVVLFARFESNLGAVASFDLGAANFGPGLSSASVAWGVVYAPTAADLIAVHPRPVVPLASMTVSPLTLSPAFSPSTFDYTVPCAAGTNNLTFTINAVAGGSVRFIGPITTAPSASQTTPIALLENQAAVVEAKNAQGETKEYWVRCLPHDFPAIVATRHPANGAPTPGYYLTANFGSATLASFAMILDTNGTPVWYQRSANQTAENVTSTGKNIVTYMNAPPAAFQPDNAIVWDIHNLATGAVTHTRFVGAPTDFHEIQHLTNGNFLLLSYPIKTGVDLTGLPGTPTPGPNSTIVDCRVQEVTPQGQVVFDWTATDHFDLKTETLNVGTATINGQTVYDPIHCNSIDPNPNGNFLISARHFRAVFEIRRSGGKVLWKLGGTAVNKDNAQIIAIQNYPATTIQLQHDARYRPTPNRISLWDNQSGTTNAGRGVEFTINFANSTAQPGFTFIPPNNRPSLATGTFRRYSDGHSVVGQGVTQTPDVFILNEVNESAQDVLDLAFPSALAVYRAQKVPSNRYDIHLLRGTAGQ